MITGFPTALSKQHLLDIQQFAEKIANEAGSLAIDGYGSASAEHKFDGSLVTEIDEASDRLLSRRIAEVYPDHAVLSEEQNTTYNPNNEFTWVIDPIDGTTNFARGLPLWGISLGLLVAGFPVVGVVVFPLLHESYVASWGQGATRNRQPIRASSLQTAESEFLLGTCTRTAREYHLDTPLKVRNLGSAAYHIVKVADGSLLGGIEATPKVWDLAGAGLILQEAGGTLRQLNGQPIFPIEPVTRDYKTISFPMIAAGNDALWKYLCESITDR